MTMLFVLEKNAKKSGRNDEISIKFKQKNQKKSFSPYSVSRAIFIDFCLLPF